jgi:hypothetical protein
MHCHTFAEQQEPVEWAEEEVTHIEVEAEAIHTAEEEDRTRVEEPDCIEQAARIASAQAPLIAQVLDIYCFAQG